MIHYSRHFHVEISRWRKWIHIGQQVMTVLLLSTIIFVDTEPRTLKSQIVPLALPKLVISLFSGAF